MAEENKVLVRWWLDEVLTRGNLRRVDELFAPHYVLPDPSASQEMHGREDIKRYVAAYRAAYPDVCFAVEDQISERDMMVTRWTARSTHRKWDYSGLVDAFSLRHLLHPKILVALGAHVAERGVQLLSVVEGFQVFEDHRPGGLPGGEAPMMDELALELSVDTKLSEMVGVSSAEPVLPIEGTMLASSSFLPKESRVLSPTIRTVPQGLVSDTEISLAILGMGCSSLEAYIRRIASRRNSGG